MWRVGDGQKVKVWEDRWLPANHMPKPISPKPANVEVAWVADLRKQEGEGWNYRLLEQCFCEEEVRLISSVHLSSLGTKDRFIWTKERTGQYNVSTGYDLAQQIKRQQLNRAESSNCAEEENVLWKRIWRLNVKRKVQHFLWRCINNSLPVLSNINKRGMKCIPICSQCGEKEETVEHIMFECSKATTVWKLAPLSWEGVNSHTQTMKQWWLELARAGNS